jgi:hypothetical protein
MSPKNVKFDRSESFAAVALSLASLNPVQHFTQAPADTAGAKVNAKRESAGLLKTPDVHRAVWHDGQQLLLTNDPIESFVFQGSNLHVIACGWRMPEVKVYVVHFLLVQLFVLLSQAWQ